MKKVLLRFSAGLGDAVQFQIVLNHLHYFRPDWEITVAARPCFHPLFHGLCKYLRDNARKQRPNPAFDMFTDGWTDVYDEEYLFGIPNYEGPDLYGPTTKPRQILDNFGIPSRTELYRYSFTPWKEGKKAAKAYYDRLCPDRGRASRWPVVLLHYEGHSCKDRKDLSEAIARRLCERIWDSGFTPLILDGNRIKHPLRDVARIHHTQNVDTLAALINAASFFIGIDSGPEHLAGTSTTPTMIIWRETHPSLYYDAAPNVRHLVLPDDYCWSHGPESLAFWRERNTWEYYFDDATIEDAVGDFILPSEPARV